MLWPPLFYTIREVEKKLARHIYTFSGSWWMNWVEWLKPRFGQQGAPPAPGIRVLER